MFFFLCFALFSSSLRRFFAPLNNANTKSTHFNVINVQSQMNDLRIPIEAIKFHFVKIKSNQRKSKLENV